LLGHLDNLALWTKMHLNHHGLAYLKTLRRRLSQFELQALPLLVESQSIALKRNQHPFVSKGIGPGWGGHHQRTAECDCDVAPAGFLHLFLLDTGFGSWPTRRLKISHLFIEKLSTSGEFDTFEFTLESPGEQTF